MALRQVDREDERRSVKVAASRIRSRQARGSASRTSSPGQCAGVEGEFVTSSQKCDGTTMPDAARVSNPRSCAAARGPSGSVECDRKGDRRVDDDHARCCHVVWLSRFARAFRRICSDRRSWSWRIHSDVVSPSSGSGYLSRISAPSATSRSIAAIRCARSCLAVRIEARGILDRDQVGQGSVVALDQDPLPAEAASRISPRRLRMSIADTVLIVGHDS